MEGRHDDFFKTVEKPGSDVAEPVGTVPNEECIEFHVLTTIDMDMTVASHQTDEDSPV